jgi:hypothetical protein
VFSLYPPGHFSSPIPNRREIRAKSDTTTREIPGIDLRAEQQLSLLQTLSNYYAELPFTATATDRTRYYYDNDFFSYGDAIILFCMLRHYRPGRVVEVGSGFSSAVMLDTKELFLQALDLTFIEPETNRLRRLLKDRGETQAHLIEERIQEADLSIVKSLNENDLLFVDSSHVLKLGSDVGHIVFQILPLLKKGVIIHFHDIPWPFEYPREWLDKGIFWNEAYFLRAFLQYNKAFEILYFNSYIFEFHREILGEKMPLCLRNPGGGLWLRKVV